MKIIHHAAISIVVSAVVWLMFRSLAATAACFLTGVFMDIDHLIDYVINYGWRFKPRNFFRAFEFECFDNVVVFLHSWEFIAVYLVLLWMIDWKPVALGALIGVFVHLLLDHLFNDHSQPAYFLSYRLFHRFSAKHFYGAEEYRKRLKHSGKQEKDKAG